jgi:hypothetical protein
LKNSLTRIPEAFPVRTRNRFGNGPNTHPPEVAPFIQSSIRNWSEVCDPVKYGPMTRTGSAARPDRPISLRHSQNAFLWMPPSGVSPTRNTTHRPGLLTPLAASFPWRKSSTPGRASRSSPAGDTVPGGGGDAGTPVGTCKLPAGAGAGPAGLGLRSASHGSHARSSRYPSFCWTARWMASTTWSKAYP